MEESHDTPCGPCNSAQLVYTYTMRLCSLLHTELTAELISIAKCTTVAIHARSPHPRRLQDTLTQLLYKGGRFQFSRLESLLAQAARAPGRSILAQERDGNAAPGSALEARHSFSKLIYLR